MNQPIAEITLPSIPESGAAVEGFVEKLLNQHAAVLGAKIFSVKSGAMVGAKRALMQTPIQGRLGLTSLSFHYQNQSIRDLSIEIKDPGAGFEVLGIHPPYPVSFVGEKFSLHRFLRHEIKAEVVALNQVRVLLSLSRKAVLEKDEKSIFCSEHGVEELKEAQEALGLIVLCQTWKNVIFTYNPEEGCTLTLSESRALPRGFASNNAFEVAAL